MSLLVLLMKVLLFFAPFYTQLENGHRLKASCSVACWLHVFRPSLAIGYSKLRVFYVSCNVTLQLRIPKNIEGLTLKELMYSVAINEAASVV